MTHYFNSSPFKLEISDVRVFMHTLRHLVYRLYMFFVHIHFLLEYCRQTLHIRKRSNREIIINTQDTLTELMLLGAEPQTSDFNGRFMSILLCYATLRLHPHKTFILIQIIHIVDCILSTRPH